jgi:sortase A
MEVTLYQAESPIRKKVIALGQKLLLLWQTSRLTSRHLKLVGFSLILLSFLILFVSLSPIVVQEIGYRLHQKPFASSPKSGQPALPSENQRQEVIKEAAQYGVETDFSIVIPKISAKAKVIPNVNPAAEKEYKSALKQGVAHALGTQFPGNQGVIYLFAHSTNSPVNIARYNAVFYLLKELRKDDEVIIFFAGQKYVYQVTERLVTNANDTKWLTGQGNEERLILQTCWPPGTSYKRLLVIARRT